MIPRLSIRLSLTISYAIFLILVLSIVDLVWFYQQEQLAENAIRAQLTQRTQLLATIISDQQTELDFTLPQLYNAMDRSLEQVYISADGNYHSITKNELQPEEVSLIQEMSRQALDGESISREYNDPESNMESLYSASPIIDQHGRTLGAICLIMPLKAFEQSMNQARRASLLLIIGAAILSTPLGFGLSTVLTRRLKNVHQMASRVANGDYTIRLSESGPKELHDLAQHLNAMADELERQSKTRNTILANLTHELARPLGGLRLGIESLRAGAMTDITLADDLLNEMGQTIQRMEVLLEDLSLAARPSRSPLHLHFEQLSFETLIHGIYSRYWQRAENQGVHLAIRLPEHIPLIEADEIRLFQILGNLIDNALKFTPSGGNVILAVEAQDDFVTIIVEDTGPGIPEAQLNRVLEPFTQAELTDQINPGMGLGLSIVNQLVLAHSGTLTLMNKTEGGLKAIVKLPISQK
jgi:signal transduction histidine kinase